MELQKFRSQMSRRWRCRREFDVNDESFLDIEKASTGKFSRNLTKEIRSRERGDEESEEGLNTKGEEEERSLISQRVSAVPRFQGQTHTGYLTFAILAPLPKGRRNVLERTAEKKREAGKEIESESGKGQREENAPAPSTSAGKKRKQHVAAVVPMPKSITTPMMTHSITHIFPDFDSICYNY